MPEPIEPSPMTAARPRDAVRPFPAAFSDWFFIGRPELVDFYYRRCYRPIAGIGAALKGAAAQSSPPEIEETHTR